MVEEAAGEAAASAAVVIAVVVAAREAAAVVVSRDYLFTITMCRPGLPLDLVLPKHRRPQSRCSGDPARSDKKRLLTKFFQVSAAVVVALEGAAVAVVVAERMSCPYLRANCLVLLILRTSPRGGGRGGRGGGPGGAKGGKKVIVEPHRHKGVFVARGGKEDLLATTNLVPGESVYGEKRISVENANKGDDAVATKTEYRVSTITCTLGQLSFM